MSENQNIEYKESWRDEFLKWICGFAESQIGKLLWVATMTEKLSGLKAQKANGGNIQQNPLWHRR